MSQSEEKEKVKAKEAWIALGEDPRDPLFNSFLAGWMIAVEEERADRGMV